MNLSPIFLTCGIKVVKFPLFGNAFPMHDNAIIAEIFDGIVVNSSIIIAPVKTKVKIAEVASHQLFCKGFNQLLDMCGFTVLDSYPNEQAFISGINAEWLPDCVFVGIELPGMGARKLVSWLKEHYPAIHVLAFCLDTTASAVQRFLDCGGKGFLYQTAEPEEIELARRTVIKRGKYYPIINNH